MVCRPVARGCDTSHKSAKRSSFSHKMGQTCFFFLRWLLKRARFKKSTFWVLQSPPSILALGLMVHTLSWQSSNIQEMSIPITEQYRDVTHPHDNNKIFLMFQSWWETLTKHKKNIITSICMSNLAYSYGEQSASSCLVWMILQFPYRGKPTTQPTKISNDIIQHNCWSDSITVKSRSAYLKPMTEYHQDWIAEIYIYYTTWDHPKIHNVINMKINLCTI